MKVILINILITYLGCTLINILFDYREFYKEYYNNEKKVISKNSTRSDGEYYKNCLLENYTQIFYPSLIQEKSDWLKMADNYNFLPLGSQPDAPVTYCNEGYGIVRYKTDRFGFRNSDDLWEKGLDVLLVGDSYVQGACVNNDKHISALMNMSGVTAVNVGTGGNGPHHYSVLMKKFIPMSKAKNVVLVFYPNDNLDVSDDNPYVRSLDDMTVFDYSEEGIGDRGAHFFDEANDFIQKKDRLEKTSVACQISEDYYLKSNEKSSENINMWSESYFSWVSFNSWLGKKKEDGSLSGLFVFDYSLNKLKMILSKAETVPKKLPITTANSIDVLADMCSADCNSLVVLLPNSEYWRPDARANKYLDDINLYIKENHSDSSIRVLDMRLKVSPDNIKFYAPLGPHLSEYGYKVVSDQIINELKLQ